MKKTDKIAERLDYDFINQPDLAQTFVVTCALMNIPFRFSGLQSLKIKETDRITALIKEMGKLGYILHEIDDRISRQYSAEHGGDSYYRQNQPDQSDSFDTQYLGIDKDQCQVQDGD